MLLESPLPRTASPELVGAQRPAACCSKARFHGPLARASGRSAARSMLLESPPHPPHVPPCTLRFRCTLDVRVSRKAGCRKRPSSVRLALQPLGLGFFKVPRTSAEISDLDFILRAAKPPRMLIPIASRARRQPLWRCIRIGLTGASYRKSQRERCAHTEFTNDLNASVMSLDNAVGD